MLYRLAFSEYTRDRVEVHAARGTPYVFTDLLALDAAQQIRDIDQKEREG